MTHRSGDEPNPFRLRKKDDFRLTRAGIVLTLLAVAVILGSALPVVLWGPQVVGMDLPRVVAIATPFLLGALVFGMGLLLLRAVGLRAYVEGQGGQDSRAGDDAPRPPNTPPDTQP
jgi:hypothetical protein